MDEFQVLQRPVLFGNDNDPSAVRQTRQCGGRLLKRLRQAFAASDSKAFNAASLVLGEASDL